MSSPSGDIYSHYEGVGVSSGMLADGPVFTLNGKPIHIISGAIHYFRVHPKLWRDRMRKLKALGANTLETYVAWNLHEPTADGGVRFGSWMGVEDWLNLSAYIQAAREEGLFVIFRPGPYICSEWEFGGLPSWLMKDKDMKVRTNHPEYMRRVESYFKLLLPQVSHLIWSTTNGAQPILAVQIENEFGSFRDRALDPPDKQHLVALKDILIENGMKDALLFTSEAPICDWDLGALPGVLQMANFQTGVEKNFAKLKELQQDRPEMVMEFWTGWFDHWLEPYHNTRPVEEFKETLEDIFKRGASVSFYMFHGGTNFGFMNGANKFSFWPHYVPDLTSYDYDCLLSESGEPTEKYWAARKLISSHTGVEPSAVPTSPPAAAYGDISVSKAWGFWNGQTSNLETLVQDQVCESDELLNMEDCSQHSGFIVYRHDDVTLKNSTLRVDAHVRDVMYVFIDGKMISKPYEKPTDLDGAGYWLQRQQTFELPISDDQKHTLELWVENCGRCNFGNPTDFADTRKGLGDGKVTLDGTLLSKWKILNLDFNENMVSRFDDLEWSPLGENDIKSGPALYLAELIVNTETSEDTFLHMAGEGRIWTKGVVWVNGFNLGKYWNVGPQMSLYLPGPLLKSGTNKIVVLELYSGGNVIHSSAEHELGPLKSQHPELKDSPFSQISAAFT